MKKNNKQAEFCFALYALLANQSSWKNISFDGYLKIVVTVDKLYCISICLVLLCYMFGCFGSNCYSSCLWRWIKTQLIQQSFWKLLTFITVYLYRHIWKLEKKSFVCVDFPFVFSLVWKELNQLIFKWTNVHWWLYQSMRISIWF